MRMDNGERQSLYTSADPLPRTSAHPQAFFQDTFRTFKLAEEGAGGPIERSYTVGGLSVRLRFAGPALLPLVTPALEHLSAPPSKAPALTVCLFDSASTATAMPPPPWSEDDYMALGEIRGYNDERFRTTYHLGSHVLSAFDARENLALYWTRDASSVPYWEASAPIRTILHWFTQGQRGQLVHAASVGTQEGCVLMAGRGGSGKSATTLACLSAEFLHIGDDYVLLRGEPTPYVYSLYNSVKLSDEYLPRLPHLAPLATNAERLPDEKALIFLHDHFPERIASGLPLKAVLSLRITERPKSRLKPSSAATSLKALAPSTIFQMPGAWGDGFRYLVDCVKQVPNHVLELGTDPSSIRETILGLLSGSGP